MGNILVFLVNQADVAKRIAVKREDGRERYGTLSLSHRIAPTRPSASRAILNFTVMLLMEIILLSVPGAPWHPTLRITNAMRLAYAGTGMAYVVLAILDPTQQKLPFPSPAPCGIRYADRVISDFVTTCR